MLRYNFSGNKKMVIPKDLPVDTDNPYLIENEGFRTASYFKTFKLCPYTAHLIYDLRLKLSDVDPVYFAQGSAIDIFVEEGENGFRSKYEILAPKVRRDTYHGDKIPFTNSDGQPLEEIMYEAKRQKLFELHNPRFTCQQEIIAEFEGVKLRSKLDRIDPKGFEIRDTKTIAHKEDGKRFYNECFFAIPKFGYDFSMSFYRGLANLAKPGDWKVYLEFLSKGTDHAKFLQVELPNEVLDPKEIEIFGSEAEPGLIHFYLECVKHNYFPTHSELYPAPWSHLNSPAYKYNPGAIQSEPVIYQEYDHDYVS